MSTLPSYCDLTPTVNSVPPEADMVMFKPYFVIPDGCTCFEVQIRVPSECYEIVSSEPGYPSGGKCTNGDEYNQLIKIDKRSGCSSSTETILKKELDYKQSADGEHIYIYVMDISAASSDVRGGSESTQKVGTQ